MIDEAHERSLQTDMALGFIKKVLRKRTDLRIIISSATLDAKVSLLPAYYPLMVNKISHKQTWFCAIIVTKKSGLILLLPLT